MENRNAAICILENSSVAGTGRVAGLDAYISRLTEGDRLTLEPDAENYFDDWAVRVLDPSGNRIGYITCEYNEIVSRLLQGGIDAFAEFQSANVRDGWTDIRIKVMVNA